MWGKHGQRSSSYIREQGVKKMLNMLWTAEYDAEWEEEFKKVVNLKK